MEVASRGASKPSRGRQEHLIVAELISEHPQDAQPAPVDDRQEWRRPQLRRMPAVEAQKANHANDGGVLTS